MSVASKPAMEVEAGLKRLREKLNGIWFFVDNQAEKLVDDSIAIIDDLLK